MDPLQLEHADLGRRAARRGESTHLVPGGQHPVAGDDQWNRISGHGLPDIARRFGSGAEFLRDGAVGGRVAPCDAPDRSVNSPEERVLPIEIKLKVGKIRLFALEIALHKSDRLGDL